MTEKEIAGVAPTAPAESSCFKQNMPCNSIKSIGARVIEPELIQRLDPLEQIICQKFVNEGKWVIRAE